jgi:hypothetical protein
MDFPVGMPILEVATATLVGNPTPALEPILEADMVTMVDNPTPALEPILEADMVIPPDLHIPGQESILVGVAATMVERVTMADMGIMEAAVTMVERVTMADMGITEAAVTMAADMATLAGEVSIWGFTAPLTTIMAPAITTVQVTTVLRDTTTNGATGTQILPVIPTE